MEIVVSQAQGRLPLTIMRIVGRINLGNTAELEKRAQELYKGGARHLVIDLAETESLTSAGLRAIITIVKAFDQGLGGVRDVKSPTVKLANPSPQINQVLTVAGFYTFLDIFGTLQEAIDSF